MAQLHEYQGKKILADHGISVPAGEVAETARNAGQIADALGGKVVVKAQIHSTSRAASGGIKFADSAAEAEQSATEMLGKVIAGNRVEKVLIDPRAEIEREFYLGFIIDDRLKRPTLLFSEAGGSGVEERAATMRKLVCSIRREPPVDEIKTICGGDEEIARVLQKLYRVAKSCEARTAEINPLARLKNRSLVALDCRISVDDYAAFRHEDLGIEIARELGHAPTRLEKIAWAVERDDFRGTFYFVEILDDRSKIQNPKSKIGFHGAGGGGSMASLDAAQRSGLQPACYVDTSGNPPASKVYRAARIILSIPNIRGYFLSGSGVASQEQFVLARGVIKAFREVRPQIPAVLRLGGNGEDYAKELVEKFTADLDFPVEAYQKKHSADFCAARLKELIEVSGRGEDEIRQENKTTEKIQNSKFKIQSSTADHRLPAADHCYSFKTRTGRVFYDHAVLENYDTTPMIESCPTKILSKNERGLPVLNIPEAEAERGKCVECLACEFAAWELAGIGKAALIDFPFDSFSNSSETANQFT